MPPRQRVTRSHSAWRWQTGQKLRLLGKGLPNPLIYCRTEQPQTGYRLKAKKLDKHAYYDHTVFERIKCSSYITENDVDVGLYRLSKTRSDRNPIPRIIIALYLIAATKLNEKKTFNSIVWNKTPRLLGAARATPQLICSLGPHSSFIVLIKFIVA